MAMNAAQHKTVNLLKTFFFFLCSSVFVLGYLICGPRQLFFQCGPEMPKGWTPLEQVGGGGCKELRPESSRSLGPWGQARTAKAVVTVKS